MSEDLFYNRDRNISGVTAPEELSFLSLNPVYGSTVNFSSKTLAYETDNSYYNIIPSSLNNLSVSYKVRYDVNEEECAKLVNFFESKEGHKAFVFNPDNSGIYKSNQSFCDNYAVNHMNNNHYELAADITVDQAPTLLNWSGMNFTNYNFQLHSEASESYKKYDVVYKQVNDVKLSNFFYCTQDHTSSAGNSPTGVDSVWTTEFFFEPDIGFQNDVAIQVSKVEFKNSFPLRIKTKKNTATFATTYKFTSINDKQLLCMLHFLENKAGYRRFKHQIPSVYNRPKVFFCPEWSHTWKYKNHHDLDVTLIEDPLGIIPKDS
jgi:phage-related protein